MLFSGKTPPEGEDDKEDFERRFHETAPMIYNLGLRLFRDQDDALDFSQEVYLQAYRNLAKFEGKSKFSTWLYSLGLNLGLNKIKKDKKMKISWVEDSSTLDYLATQPETPAAGEDPFEYLSREEFSDQVWEQLSKLPDMYRLPLILYYYEKMSYRDIARQLKIKEGTLKSYLHRGKLMLRKGLLARGYEDET